MSKTYIETIRETIDEAMAKDESVILIGEDIGVYGGAFGVTKDLFSKYPNRVIETPMSEQAITGLGIGMALAGLKPIVEIMFMDFVTLAYDQLFNHACIFSYLSCGEVNVPLIIRTPAGAGRGYGASHSKTLIAPLMHIPGIKIVYPSNSEDARGLLKSCFNEKNPVIFIENKSLYGSKSEINEDVPIGKGKIIKKGNKILIISFGKSVYDCLEIANEFEEKGINIEVLDLRTIKPLDIDLIKQEVEKIGKVIIVDEGYSECGVASEIISRINETCFYSLDGKIKRINLLDFPIACCPSLENQIFPGKDRIRKAVLEVLNE